jgi:hypothetical protein
MSRDVGAMTPYFIQCYRKQSVPSFEMGGPSGCALFGGNFIALNDASCKACRGMEDVRERYRHYVDDGGLKMSLREFIFAYGGSNPFIERVQETAKAIAWQSSL